MHQRRAVCDRLIDRLENRIEQSDGNRTRVANRKLKVADARGALFYALLAQGNDGSNRTGIVFGQPFRIGERSEEESRGNRGY